MTWDPKTYSRFAAPRLRPALDLLARVDADEPGLVADLGCGTGTVTRLLARRWLKARVVGVDSSAEMLAEAGADTDRLSWSLGDIGTWEPDRPLDVVFSNAALHWLDDHAALLPRLMSMLARGGWLAVQMPRNHGAPSHRLMVEAARSGPWADRLEPLLRPGPVAEPSVYYDVLAPLADRLDIWETEYLQVLDGDNPVVEWVTGTALKPLLDALDEPGRGRFLADYAARIRAAYPPHADGKTLFPFRRLFVVARRR